MSSHCASVGRKSPFAGGRWVGLTFDDGTDFDFIDLAHPHLGLIKSFYTILREAAGPNGDRWPKPIGVSFVIASPEARKVLDRTCIAGLGQWRDTWWRDAARSGILAIGNHSWDHTHETLETIAQREQRKGTFYGVDNFEDADRQIRRAQEYINERTGRLSTRLFRVSLRGGLRLSRRSIFRDTRALTRSPRLSASRVNT
jgi:hypothetical protein